MLNKTKISDEILYDIVKRELERQEKKHRDDCIRKYCTYRNNGTFW